MDKYYGASLMLLVVAAIKALEEDKKEIRVCNVVDCIKEDLEGIFLENLKQRVRNVLNRLVKLEKLKQEYKVRNKKFESHYFIIEPIV